MWTSSIKCARDDCIGTKYVYFQVENSAWTGSKAAFNLCFPDIQNPINEFLDSRTGFLFQLNVLLLIHGVGLDILTGVVNIQFDQFLGTNASKAVTPKDL